MKLFYTPFDYVHAVEAVINYGELNDRIEPIATDPFAADVSKLTDNNPLGTVPTLVGDDGAVYYGGPVLYEYLDTLHDKAKLFPADPARNFIVRRQLWLADALFDAAVRLVIEGWQPPEARRADYAERTWGKIARGLDQFESEAGDFGPLDIGQIRLVTSLNYLDTKLPEPFGEMVAAIKGDENWRDDRPTLAAWHAKTAADPIFRFIDEKASLKNGS